MTHVITFDRPGALMNLNDRTHWAVKMKLVKAWRTAARLASAGVPLLGRSLVSVDLPVRSAKKLRDPSNWVPTVKAIVDGITDAGVWPNDDSRYVVTEEPSFHQGGQTVTVAVTPC